MHPSKFIEEVRLVNGRMNIAENEELKKQLESIHPMNWLSSDLRFCISKITVSYDTNKGNRKTSEKYAVQLLDLTSGDDPDMLAEIQADSDISKFLVVHSHTDMKNYKIEHAEVVTTAVLRIE